MTKKANKGKEIPQGMDIWRQFCEKNNNFWRCFDDLIENNNRYNNSLFKKTLNILIYDFEENQNKYLLSLFDEDQDINIEKLENKIEQIKRNNQLLTKYLKDKIGEEVNLRQPETTTFKILIEKCTIIGKRSSNSKSSGVNIVHNYIEERDIGVFKHNYKFIDPRVKIERKKITKKKRNR